MGHPLSAERSLEWRLSFSIAERPLVWSFNHTQLQCYAIMKLILKELVKTSCTEANKNVLCSYFIKTFLFWQFETTDSKFWQTSNLINCIIYLLNAFSDCIRTGVLRHYFVSRFNLLEIKLSRDAQSELLHLFEMVLEIGIPILEQCDSLSVVFSKFRQFTDINQCRVHKKEVLRYRAMDNDSVFMDILTLKLLHNIHIRSRLNSFAKMLIAVVRLTDEGHCSTVLIMFAIRYLCRLIATSRLYSYFNQGNKCVYDYTKLLNNNVYGTDITSSKLLLATFWIQRGDYCRSLQTINDILSSIPPYAVYYSGCIKTNYDS